MSNTEHSHRGPNGQRVAHNHSHGDVSHSHSFMWRGEPGRRVLTGWTYYGGPEPRADDSLKLSGLVLDCDEEEAR